MLCGDNRPIYTDIEYARKYSPTGKRLVDPLLVQCLYYSLIDNTEYNAKSARSLLALLGITYLEILKNPSIGDTIHAEQEIINLSDNKPDRGIVTMRLEILNQNNEVLQRSIIAALFGKRIFFEKE
jgi:acyl dehydratase